MDEINTPETALDGEIQALMKQMRAAKPNNRSDIDRAYAVALTDLEKISAYWYVYAVRPSIDAVLEDRWDADNKPA